MDVVLEHYFYEFAWLTNTLSKHLMFCYYYRFFVQFPKTTVLVFFNTLYLSPKDISSRGENSDPPRSVNWW